MSLPLRQTHASNNARQTYASSVESCGSEVRIASFVAFCFRLRPLFLGYLLRLFGQQEQVFVSGRALWRALHRHGLSRSEQRLACDVSREQIRHQILELGNPGESLPFFGSCKVALLFGHGHLRFPALLLDALT